MLLGLLLVASFHVLGIARIAVPLAYLGLLNVALAFPAFGQALGHESSWQVYPDISYVRAIPSVQTLHRLRDRAANDVFGGLISSCREQERLNTEGAVHNCITPHEA